MTGKANSCKGTLFVISGPSGVGKGTLRKELFKKVPELSYSVSCTTRKPRQGEQDGVDYFFIDDKTFERHLEAGEFLEWAEVHGNRYGTLEKTVRDSLDRGCDVILEIDVQGAAQVKKRMPEAVLIFIAPPGEEELRRRLSERGTEKKQELLKRLENARKELEESDKYDHLVVNDDIKRASEELAEIIDFYRDKRKRNTFSPGGDS